MVGGGLATSGGGVGSRVAFSRVEREGEASAGLRGWAAKLRDAPATREGEESGPEGLHRRRIRRRSGLPRRGSGGDCKLERAREGNSSGGEAKGTEASLGVGFIEPRPKGISTAAVIPLGGFEGRTRRSEGKEGEGGTGAGAAGFEEGSV